MRPGGKFSQNHKRPALNNCPGTEKIRMSSTTIRESNVHTQVSMFHHINRSGGPIKGFDYFFDVYRKMSFVQKLRNMPVWKMIGSSKQDLFLKNISCFIFINFIYSNVGQRS